MPAVTKSPEEIAAWANEATVAVETLKTLVKLISKKKSAGALAEEMIKKGEEAVALAHQLLKKIGGSVKSVESKTKSLKKYSQQLTVEIGGVKVPVQAPTEKPKVAPTAKAVAQGKVTPKQVKEVVKEAVKVGVLSAQMKSVSGRLVGLYGTITDRITTNNARTAEQVVQRSSELLERVVESDALVSEADALLAQQGTPADEGNWDWTRFREKRDRLQKATRELEAQMVRAHLEKNQSQILGVQTREQEALAKIGKNPLAFTPNLDASMQDDYVSQLEEAARAAAGKKGGTSLLEALDAYNGERSDELLAKWNSKKPPPEVVSLKALVENTPSLPGPMNAYRGMRLTNDQVQQLIRGGSMDFDTIRSVSSSPESAWRFTTGADGDGKVGVLIEFRGGHGSMMPMHLGEESPLHGSLEYWMKPGSSFKVVAVEQDAVVVTKAGAGFLEGIEELARFDDIDKGSLVGVDLSELAKVQTTEEAQAALEKMATQNSNLSETHEIVVKDEQGLMEEKASAVKEDRKVSYRIIVEVADEADEAVQIARQLVLDWITRLDDAIAESDRALAGSSATTTALAAHQEEIRRLRAEIDEAQRQFVAAGGTGLDSTYLGAVARATGGIDRLMVGERRVMAEERRQQRLRDLAEGKVVDNGVSRALTPDERAEIQAKLEQVPKAAKTHLSKWGGAGYTPIREAYKVPASKRTDEQKRVVSEWELAYNAMPKLPTQPTLMRGARWDPERIDAFQPGGVVEMNTPNSWTSNPSSAASFADDPPSGGSRDPNRHPVVLVLEGQEHRMLDSIPLMAQPGSVMREEYEHLVAAGQSYEVLKVSKEAVAPDAGLHELTGDLTSFIFHTDETQMTSQRATTYMMDLDLAAGISEAGSPTAALEWLEDRAVGNPIIEKFLSTKGRKSLDRYEQLSKIKHHGGSKVITRIYLRHIP